MPVKAVYVVVKSPLGHKIIRRNPLVTSLRNNTSAPASGP